MMQKIGAVILAAGLSRRMGTPKMLLPWGHTSVLGQVIATYAQAGLREIVIVTGGARELVEAEVRRLNEEFPVRCVHNAQYESGNMLTSLQCGLAAHAQDVSSSLIGLGDQPQLSPLAVQAVLSAYAQASAQLIVPSYQMRRGHPWLVQRALWQQLMLLEPPQTLRDFLNARSQEIFYIEADQTILKDLDTPEDYQREKP